MGLLFILPQLASQAEKWPGVVNSAGAGSPFDVFTARVAIYLLLVGVLVSVLLIGAFMILTFGLLSKRADDRKGTRNPSDIGILKTTNWPEEPYEVWALPPEEETSEEEKGKGTQTKGAA